MKSGDETQEEWVASEDQELKQNIIRMLKQSGIDHTAELVSSYVDTFGTAYALAVILEKFDSAGANPTVVRC
jgi:hypothetical protein